MPLRLTVLACASVLAAACLPAPAGAADSSGGGTAAPTKSRSAGGASGGTVVGQRPARKKRRRAPRRRRAQAPRRTPAAPPAEAGHRFPVAGPYEFGGQDARFGARRQGHRHQGQDIAAAEGSPVVAPYGGVVEYVRYQRRGAGWYVVLDGTDEDRDYVFMHLRRGSVLVAPGQAVTAGQPLAQVGNTGRSFGAHLHFEVWVGGWYAKGGRPVDPLPLLQQWAAA